VLANGANTNPIKSFAKHKHFPFFAFKLGHFIVNASFLMLQTLKLNRGKQKMKKSKVW